MPLTQAEKCASLTKRFMDFNWIPSLLLFLQSFVIPMVKSIFPFEFQNRRNFREKTVSSIFLGDFKFLREFRKRITIHYSIEFQIRTAKIYEITRKSLFHWGFQGILVFAKIKANFWPVERNCRTCQSNEDSPGSSENIPPLTTEMTLFHHFYR